ncbi:MAG: energy-coupling factor transporter ATPase [Ruminococcaceae bacterium]|nr:energy-coupling factor transporter ATPase [Oscillospiraceae bacterium]
MANEAVIKTEELTYVYGKGTPFYRVALDRVSLSIEKGSVTGIIGHTGSGKSTLVQHFNRLLKPESGTVSVSGKDIWEKTDENGKICFKVGLVFQYPEYQLFEETVEADVAYGPKNMGLSEEEINERVKRSLQLVGLSESYLQQSPFELSGGQKRRVAIAGIMAMEPEVLVLDEPAAGLDPQGRKEIFSGILRYREQTGKTVIIVSHSMEDMASYCDSVIVMNRGEVFLSGQTREVFSKADALSSVHLNVPQITSFMSKLQKMGYPVPSDVLTVEDAADVLVKLLGGEGTC